MSKAPGIMKTDEQPRTDESTVRTEITLKDITLRHEIKKGPECACCKKGPVDTARDGADGG